MFETILKVAMVIISVALIILCLLQSGKSEGFTGAFTGGKGLDLFSNTKERGAEKVISNLTMGAGFVFFVLVLVILKTQG